MESTELLYYIGFAENIHLKDQQIIVSPFLTFIRWAHFPNLLKIYGVINSCFIIPVLYTILFHICVDL